MNNGPEKRCWNVLWMLPDILCLHGGRGDAMALARQAETFGACIDMRRVSRLSEHIDFLWADLLLFGPGELAALPAVRDALWKEQGALDEYLAAGKGVFCTGTTGALFAKETHRADGSVWEGLGALDMVCRERDMPYGDDLVFRAPGLDRAVCGVQIQMVDTELAEGQAPLGDVLYGRGNGAGSGGAAAAEGAVRTGLVWTNALGPVLAKNPWFTLWLMKRLLPGGEALPETDDDDVSVQWGLETESARAIWLFNEKKGKPHASET
ncbi:MAG: hypothetical protein LBR00_00095 [Clostridiales Family XIII bacterium]|jgi:CobQ-like glutamine amidotransferase family enzyme|nr:hypothetical protein [Clostridiales Family XIII bacterium]